MASSVFAPGESLEACAAAYRRFCGRYQATAKAPQNYHWGNRLLAGLAGMKTNTVSAPAGDPSKRPRRSGRDAKDVISPPERCQVSDTPLLVAVAERLIAANRLPPAGNNDI